MAKGNRKVVFLSPAKAEKWYLISNLFAKSLLSSAEAIQEYNKLTPTQREGIQARLKNLDGIRQHSTLSGFEKDEMNQHYFISVLVDSHIVATEYDTDPVVVIMCVDPPCLLSQKVIVK